MRRATSSPSSAGPALAIAGVWIRTARRSLVLWHAALWNAEMMVGFQISEAHNCNWYHCRLKSVLVDGMSGIRTWKGGLMMNWHTVYEGPSVMQVMWNSLGLLLDKGDSAITCHLRDIINSNNWSETVSQCQSCILHRDKHHYSPELEATFPLLSHHSRELKPTILCFTKIVSHLPQFSYHSL